MQRLEDRAFEKEQHPTFVLNDLLRSRRRLDASLKPPRFALYPSRSLRLYPRPQEPSSKGQSTPPRTQSTECRPTGRNLLLRHRGTSRHSKHSDLVGAPAPPTVGQRPL